MANIKKAILPYSITGVLVQVEITREADGFLLDDTDGAFADAPADSLVDTTENGSGVYELEEDRTVWDDGKYIVAGYVSTDLDTIIAIGKIEILDDVEIAQSSAESAGMSDSVWDEILNKAGHNIGMSAGKRLRQLATLISADASINDPSPTSTSFITTLTSTVDDLYADQVVAIVDDTSLIGQSRVVLSYDGTTKRITVDEPYSLIPVDGSDIIIFSPHVHPVSQIADAVLDELVAEHTTPGSLGQHIADLHDEAFGKWTFDKDALTLTLLKVNGDPLTVFDLTDTTSAINPILTRTPQ